MNLNVIINHVQRYFFPPLVISCFYAVILLLLTPDVLTSRFDQLLVDRYYKSQDIPTDVKGRIFLSDGEIHTAAGYLYWQGADPAVVNFQHPPLIKYLFGLAVIVFNNPLVVQVVFGYVLLLGIFFITQQITNNKWFSVLPALCISLDPGFHHVLSSALLDLGQTVFLLFFVFLRIWFPRQLVLAGICLGCAAASKFWAGALFFFGVVTVVEWLIKSINIKKSAQLAGYAVLTFILWYAPSFWIQGGAFNIVFFELKSLKYWFQHSTASLYGSALLMFTTSWFQSWWGDRGWVRTEIWSPTWPLLLIMNSLFAVRNFMIKGVTPFTFILVLPLLYLIYLGAQAPFARYYIVIIPWLYIAGAVIAHGVIERWRADTEV